MSHRTDLWRLLAGLLSLPLLSMWLVPLVDTSEPRYAEISRLMAQTGDWFTPWFEPGLPFWGKPPLSFWAQAISFKLLGVHEFAARLPSWLATLGTVGLLSAYTNSYFCRRTAQWAAIIYVSCGLVYVASGAVLTDPFLTLGTTWSMTAFTMAQRKPTWVWRYGFFIGLAIGLLAKGPLVLVLVAGPLVGWLLWHPSARQNFRSLPWGRGVLLTLALSVPWYVLAELKTPGFLNYFIIGEHFLRFIEPDWHGDLYGTAHKRAYGTIWGYWLVAAFPWSILALGGIIHGVFKADSRAKLPRILKDPTLCYLFAWALFPPVFFTLSGNILLTYVLPALAPFSILMAALLNDGQQEVPRFARSAYIAVCIVPIAVLILTVVTLLRPMSLKTERDLVQYVQRKTSGGQRLFYLDSRPFSARFYSRGTAEVVSMDQLPATLMGPEPIYLAIPKDLLDEAKRMLTTPVHKEFENRRHVLIEINPNTQRAR